MSARYEHCLGCGCVLQHSLNRIDGLCAGEHEPDSCWAAFREFLTSQKAIAVAGPVVWTDDLQSFFCEFKTRRAA